MLAMLNLQMLGRVVVHKLCQLDVEVSQHHHSHQHQEANLACMDSLALIVGTLQGPIH